jgi:hypothetical protein
VPSGQIEAFLKDRRGGTPADRALAAQLSGGSPGAALSLDLQESARLRRTVLRLLEQAVAGDKYSDIFAATAQLSKQERESFENILELFYSFLTDLLELPHSPKSSLPRNPDLRREVEALARKVDWEWVSRATRCLDTLEVDLRRNIGRQLGLDAVVASLSAR